MGKLHDHDKIILEHEHSWLTVKFFVELETKFDFLSCILFLTIFKFAAVAFFPHNKKKKKMWLTSTVLDSTTYILKSEENFFWPVKGVFFLFWS